MALYDPNDLIDVSTPQGPMRMPSSVAATLGLMPVQPLGVGTSMGPGPSPPPPPPPPSPPQLPPPPPQTPAPMPTGPSTNRRKHMIGPALGGGGAVGGVELPQVPAAPPSANVSTEGIPPEAMPVQPPPGYTAPTQAPAPAAPTTAADLRRAGIGGALDATMRSLADQEQAGKDKADAEATQQAAFAGAYEKRNQQIDDLLKQRADDANRRQSEIEAKMADYSAAVDKYANTKIDRSVDHPILAAISLALGAFGSAMKGSGENPALSVLFQSIDRKVQGQMADQQKLGQVANMKRSDIDMLRTKANDSTAKYNNLIAGETMKAANQIEAIGARSSSDIVRANAKELSAQLKQKAADAVGQAVMAQQSKDDKDRDFAFRVKSQQQSVGLQYAQMAQSAKQFKMGLDEQIREHDLARQDKLDELALGYAKLGKQEQAAAAKEQATTGVFDPTSGNAVLTPEGQKAVARADALEAQARNLPPDQADKARQQAQAMRDQAEIDYGFRIEDKDDRREVIKSIGAGQKLIDVIDRIKGTLGQDPSSVDRSTWAGLKTDFESAKADWIAAHGGKPSSREFDAISEMFGDDPESMVARVSGRGKMGTSLDHLKQTAISDTTTDLQARGYKGTWVPHSATTDDETPLQGQTSVEAADAAEPSPLGKVYRFAATGSTASPGGGGVLDPEGRAENGGDFGPTGLSAQDTAQVRSLTKAYANATDAKRAQIKQQLQNYASSNRLPLAQGVVTLLKGENPELYHDVVQGLAPSRQSDLGVDLRSQAQVLASLPLDQLITAAAVNDKPSRSELARRAAAGDRQAQKAVLAIVNSTGAR